MLFLCALCFISSLNLYGADDKDAPNKDTKSGTSTQNSNNANGSSNMARGPVTNVPQNGGYDLRDPRYYDGKYYGGGYYQPSYPSYYRPQIYDPRNYGQYYDPYDPRNYERYYYNYMPQYPIYPQYPQDIPSNGAQHNSTPSKNQPQENANNEVKWFDDGKQQPIQLAPFLSPDVAISYAPRIPPMPYSPNNVNVLRPSYNLPKPDNPLENALADPKSASATLNAGIDAARKGDYKKALTMLNTACDQGNPAGCFGVGIMFMYGAGVQSDTQKAIKYYQKGCAGGDPTACANLGMIYDEAPNMGNNKQKAAEMYMTGCAGGDIEACNNIGWAYANGSGVPKDINKALQYYRFACDAGSQLGCYNLGLLNNAGNIYGIDAAKMNPVDLNYVACNAGDIVGCANLGYIYAQGLEGAPRNYGLAAQYFNTACIGGVASSCNNLGVLYEQGRGITQNTGQALEMYSLACEAGLYNGCDNYKNLKAKIGK